MTPTPFWKVHGAGNDFVLLDQVDAPRDVPPETAVRLCDRHTGVGADGLLIIRRDADGTWRLIILNADGSRPEMCGNGIRCVARHLREVRGDTSDPVAIRTDAGLRTCRVTPVPGGDWQVEVAMGPAEVGASDETVQAGGRTHTFRRVSVGNPHAILASDDPWADATAYGPALEVAPTFPNRSNIELVQRLSPDAVKVVVHERGCGITQACGTGATAVAAAYIETGRHPADKPLAVHLPGGVVTIRKADDGTYLMTGPATVVFRGEITV